ncbi:hypothetical protein [Brachybacterium sp. SGAir0954]|nr:hypothetical protein [Brachybacterium sp. SGAir0954]
MSTPVPTVPPWIQLMQAHADRAEAALAAATEAPATEPTEDTE